MAETTDQIGLSVLRASERSNIARVALYGSPQLGRLNIRSSICSLPFSNYVMRRAVFQLGGLRQSGARLDLFAEEPPRNHTDLL